MRAKKTTTPRSRSVRYLLSADRRLKKLSLRRLSERLKQTKARSTAASGKTTAAAKPAAAAKAAMASKAPEPPVAPPPKAYSWRAIVIGMTCVLAAAALMTARQPVDEVEGASGAGRQPAPATMSVAAAKPPSTPAPKAVSKPPSYADSNGAAGAASNAASNATPAPTRTPDADAATMTTVSAAGIKPEAPVATITGCLDRDDDAFWLKDASGDVPKSRSWKTGFLRKRSPRIELVGGPGAAALAGYVGQRVEATGTLVDRELRARSVRRIAASCR